MWVVVVFGFALIALVFFLFLNRPGKTSHTIQSRLFYNYPLEFFPHEFTMSSGNPNHPDNFSVQIGLNSGSPAKPQYGIKVSSSQIYGTSRTNITLNVETGFLLSDTSVSGIETHYALAPPEQGGNYFDYLTQLAALKVIVETVAAGCYLPEEGFRFPPRPELKGTINYIAQIVQQLQNTRTINSVTVRLPHLGLLTKFRQLRKTLHQNH